MWLDVNDVKKCGNSVGCLREVLLVSPSVAQCGQSKIPAALLLFRVNSKVRFQQFAKLLNFESFHLKPKGHQTSLIRRYPNLKNTLIYHHKALSAKLYPAMNLQSGRRPEVIHKLQYDARYTVQWMDSLHKRCNTSGVEHATRPGVSTRNEFSLPVS